MNNIYEFTLVLEGVNDKTPHLEDSLFEAGCDDALINFRNSTVYLDFSREAPSFEEAVFSSISAVENCSLGARVLRILPDELVSVSDIAKRLNKDRQLVSMWVKGERRASDFPPPVLRLSEKSPFWRWYSVVKWLLKQNVISDPNVLHDAQFVENMNAALDERDPEVRRCRYEMIHKLEAMSDNDMQSNRQQ